MKVDLTPEALEKINELQTNWEVYEGCLVDIKDILIDDTGTCENPQKILNALKYVNLIASALRPIYNDKRLGD